MTSIAIAKLVARTTRWDALLQINVALVLGTRAWIIEIAAKPIGVDCACTMATGSDKAANATKRTIGRKSTHIDFSRNYNRRWITSRALDITTVARAIGIVCAAFVDGRMPTRRISPKVNGARIMIVA